MIIPLFTDSDLQDDIDEFLKQQINKTKGAFQSVGIDIVNDAKNKGTYKDFSSNLRSSVGFKIFMKNSEISQVFYGKNSEGIEKGKSKASENKKGNELQLVVVAGMEYAEKVEIRHEGGVLENYINIPKIRREIKQLLE